MTKRNVGFLLAAVLLAAVLLAAVLLPVACFLAWLFLPRLPFRLDRPGVSVTVTVNSAEEGASSFDLTVEEIRELHELWQETGKRFTDWPVNGILSGIDFGNSSRIFHISADRPGESASFACLEDGRLIIGTREYRMEDSAITDFLEEAMAAKPDVSSSFTAEKTFSYDRAYYALQSAEEIDGVSQVVVSVYRAEDDGLLDSFIPARARDFWGICWERDSYRIWTQSADIGIHCYEYADGRWELNPAAVRPEYIRSKYD